TNDEEVAYYSSTYFGSAKPVIAYNDVVVFTAYKKNSSSGISQRSKWNNSGTWVWGSEGTVPNTNSYSVDPTVAGRYNNIYLAYQHSLTIKYIFGYPQGNNWLYNNYTTISTGSGYSNNFAPSISLTGNFHPVVSWIGSSIGSGDPGGEKIKGTGGNESKVVVRRGHGTWSSFFKAATNTVNTNHNSITTTSTE